MKIGDIKNKKIARKYSNALLEMALEKDVVSKVYDDLTFVCETLNSNKQLEEVFYNPVISINDKKDIIEKLFSVHVDKITLDFLFLLIEANRTEALNEVLNQYSASFNEYNNVVKPVVISAVELNENQKSRIIEKLQNKMTKTIQPEYQINPEIIGGLVIEINDMTIDCSLKTKFENMKKQLTKGNRYGNN